MTTSITTSETYPDHYLFSIIGWCTNDSNGNQKCDPGTELRFTIKNIKNPSLLKANVSPFSWKLLTTDISKKGIDGKVEDLKPTPDLQGVQVKFSGLSVESLVIDSDTTVSWTFSPNSILPASTFIILEFPPKFAKRPATEKCLAIEPSQSVLSCQYSYSNDYITQIRVNNVCASTACGAQTLYSWKTNIKMRPNTKDVGEKFIIVTKTSS